MKSEPLVETDNVFIHEDGTYVYKDWSATQIAFWKMEEGELYFRHNTVTHEWYRCLDFPNDQCNTDRWLDRIVTALVEREIFND